MAFNNKTIWQSYLNRDYANLFDPKSNEFTDNPFSLYIKCYLANGKKAKVYVAILLSPDSNQIIGGNAIRLLNRLFIKAEAGKLYISNISDQISDFETTPNATIKSLIGKHQYTSLEHRKPYLVYILGLKKHHQTVFGNHILMKDLVEVLATPYNLLEIGNKHNWRWLVGCETNLIIC